MTPGTILIKDPREVQIFSQKYVGKLLKIFSKNKNPTDCDFTMAAS